MNLIFNLFFLSLSKGVIYEVHNKLNCYLFFCLLPKPFCVIEDVPTQCLCFMETSNLTSIGSMPCKYMSVADHCVSIYQKVFFNGVFTLFRNLCLFWGIYHWNCTTTTFISIWRPLIYKSDISTLTVRVCLAPPGSQFSLGGVKPDEEGRVP